MRDELSKQATEMLKEMGVAEDEMAGQYMSAEEAASIARVMECASRFMQIYARQSELVNRLQRFESKTKGEDLRLLASLGGRQGEIRKDLVALAADMKERASKLSDYYNALKQSTLAFADKIDSLEIPDLMNKAVVAAVNQDGMQSFHNATLALERLEQLMEDSKDDAFGGLCQGQMKFQVRKDMQETLQQMMQSMSSGVGKAAGMAGAGGGGDDNDGYSVGGYSTVNTPMFGPSRTSIPGGGTTGKSRGDGGKGVNPNGVKIEEAEHMSVGGSSTILGESLPLEEVPAKYRDAVKKYFSDTGK